MIIVASLEAVAIVAIVGFFLRHIRALEAANASERRELCSRIQRPEIIPAGPSAPFLMPEPEQDDTELVGTIRYEPEGD